MRSSIAASGVAMIPSTFRTWVSPIHGATGIVSGVVEQAGGDPIEEGFESWETGADDSNVDFHRGPGGGLDIVPGYICRDGDDVECVKAEDRDYAYPI